MQIGIHNEQFNRNIFRGGVNQRWLIVYTQAARERAGQTVNKQHLKQSQAEYNAFTALANQNFVCVADAKAALAKLQKILKVVALPDFVG